MHRIRHLLALAFVIVLAAIVGVAPGVVMAQTFPFQNPTYLPSGIVGATTCSAACDVVFNTGGESTITVRVSGSGSGIAAIVQGTESVAAAPTWSTLNVHPIGAGATSPATAGSIAGTGLWRVNAAGLAQVRLHLTAVTGSVSVSMAGSDAAGVNTMVPERKATYSASIVGLSPAASATDFLTVTGSATATVRITRAECFGVSTAAASATIEAIKRSTANTSGTSAAMTAVPYDSQDAAATATALDYTANPTLGTSLGIIRAGKLMTDAAATNTTAPPALVWNFGTGAEQEVVLRGVTQVFALNGAGASFAAGAALTCSVTWEEE